MKVVITKLENNSWQVSNLWNQPKIFVKPITVYRKIENGLKKMANEDISIAVDYDSKNLKTRKKVIVHGNETTANKIKDGYEYLMYSLTCFLERYLKEDFVGKRLQKYGA